MKRLAVIALLAVIGCHKAPKMNMTPKQVIDTMTDIADRGCACGQDKECFHAIRDEWDNNVRNAIQYNSALLKGDDQKAFLDQRTRFALCGDAAGVGVPP